MFSQPDLDDYLGNISKANSEAAKKEIFKDLINRLFHDIDEIKKIINKISLSAEKSVLNIPLKDRKKTDGELFKNIYFNTNW